MFSENVDQLFSLGPINITEQKISKQAGKNRGRLNTGWISIEVETT